MKLIFWGRDGKDVFLRIFIITSIPELSKSTISPGSERRGIPSQACHVILYTSQGEALSNGTGGTFV